MGLWQAAGMDDRTPNPTGAALMEFTCRFLTVMLDRELIDADGASEMLSGVERALLTGEQSPESMLALAAASVRARSADIG